MAGGGKRRPRGAAGPAGEQSEKNGAVKKRRSNQADNPNSVCQEAETCYQLRLPEDFYQFWKFCEELDPEKPSDALVSSVGLKLVGPYDILAGKHKKAKSTDVNFNLHWRFFYDPPEFQTILVGDGRTQYHMGYFRDVPDELPVWVGANEAKKGCVISQVGDNVFAAVKLLLSKKLKEVADKTKNAVLKDIDEKLTRTAKELGYSLEQKTLKMKQRDKKVVTKAFHGAGLVVPVDKNDVGYRELPETNANLKKICKAIVDAPTDEERVKAFAPIQEMLTFVQFANDECDYGMGYELGMDLFCYGSHRPGCFSCLNLPATGTAVKEMVPPIFLILPQDGGPAAAPGLHPAEEEPLRGNHRAAPGQPAGGGAGSAGALSPGLQLGGGPARPGPGLSLCVCLWVFLYLVAVSPAVSKGFLRNALLPGAGCARQARARERG